MPNYRFICASRSEIYDQIIQTRALLKSIREATQAERGIAPEEVEVHQIQLKIADVVSTAFAEKALPFAVKTADSLEMLPDEDKQFSSKMHFILRAALIRDTSLAPSLKIVNLRDPIKEEFISCLEKVLVDTACLEEQCSVPRPSL